MSVIPIPRISVAPLFDRASDQRDLVDLSIMSAAADTGFMTICDLPSEIAATADVRRRLLRFFSLPESEKSKLLRHSFDPTKPNVYRGFFPLQDGGSTYKEGIDMGPDIARSDWRAEPSDPLTEATPLPDEAVLPGWRRDVGAYYLGMERLGAVLMQSLARSLGLQETMFNASFKGGISTLRLIRYPVRPAHLLKRDTATDIMIEHNGSERYLIGGAHVDSAFVTLLAQDGVEGLQAKSREGTWIDVPPIEGSIAVNFGGLLERWTGGRIRATEHRVLGPGRERFSIPFFYEPRVDAVISPLDGSPEFAPFTYGDHLWAAMTKFVEFRDVKALRKPRGAAFN